MNRLLQDCLKDLTSFYHDHSQLCGGVFVACMGAVVVGVWWTRHSKAGDTQRKDYPQDTVILHHPGRGPFAPSNVPFAIKLETYLRMAKIPYQSEFSGAKSKKKKFPWIAYNGEEMADSAFIMQFLNKRYDLDLSGWLTPEQKGVAVAFQRLVEDNLYWTLVVFRFVHEVEMDFLTKLMPLSATFIRLLVMPPLKKATWAQGTGRHSPEEVRQIARENLTALKNFLGKKQFLMGDQPCEHDCAVFGQLAQFYWQAPKSMAALFKDEFPELVRYCERMKDTFWPDWTQCTTQGGTEPATS